MAATLHRDRLETVINPFEMEWMQEMGALKGLFGFAAAGCSLVAGFGWVFLVILPAMGGFPVPYLGNAVIWTLGALVCGGIYKALAGTAENAARPPTAPPTRTQSQSFSAYATDSLRESLLSSRTPVSGRNILANDAMLHTYHETDVDWRAIWASSSTKAVGVPAFGVRPYWVPSGGPGGGPVPLTALAFRGAQTRRQVAMDPETPELTLRILAEDPDPSVRSVLAR